MKLKKYRKLLLFILLNLFFNNVLAKDIPLLTINNTGGGAHEYSLSMQILMLMTGLSLLPAILLSMTSFTRVIIVLSILRQALGMPQTPSNQVLIGLALFLTFFIMSPIFNEINDSSITPYLENKISFKSALELTQVPVKKFMLQQVRTEDLSSFKEISGATKADSDAPMSVLIPAFVTSEMKTAFQMGFLLFIPFLIIDLVIASVLMAMGMMMLSPLIISLPFKIMLFILVDGWTLVINTLAASFY